MIYSLVQKETMNEAIIESIVAGALFHLLSSRSSIFMKKVEGEGCGSLPFQKT
jgi:hypothetical protein